MCENKCDFHKKVPEIKNILAFLSGEVRHIRTLYTCTLINGSCVMECQY